jgi:hypothetical protein
MLTKSKYSANQPSARNVVLQGASGVNMRFNECPQLAVPESFDTAFLKIQRAAVILATGSTMVLLLPLFGGLVLLTRLTNSGRGRGRADSHSSHLRAH